MPTRESVEGLGMTEALPAEEQSLPGGDLVTPVAEHAHSRRQVLQAALGSAVAALAPVRVRAQDDPANPDTAGALATVPRNVLILGAGMAGLTAAVALSARGHDVTVIEYQNRVGGRLLSVPLQDGQVTEAGGGHFRSNMPLVLSYLRHFALPVISLNDGLPRYLIGGQTADAADLANWPWELTAAERGVSVASNLNRYLFLNGLDTTTVLSPTWPDPATLHRLDGLSVGDMIRQVGGSPAFLALLDAHGGTFTSRSPALGRDP